MGKNFPNAITLSLAQLVLPFRWPTRGSDDSAISSLPNRACLGRPIRGLVRSLDPEVKVWLRIPLAGKLLPQRCRESHSVDIQRRCAANPSGCQAITRVLTRDKRACHISPRPKFDAPQANHFALA